MKYVSIPSYVWYKFAHNQKPGGRPSQGGRKTVSLIQSLKFSNCRMLSVVRWFPLISEIQRKPTSTATLDPGTRRMDVNRLSVTDKERLKEKKKMIGKFKVHPSCITNRSYQWIWFSPTSEERLLLKIHGL